MDLITLLRIMWRRWFVVVPVLLVAAVAGLVLIVSSDVRYTSSGSVLLLLNRQATQGGDGGDAVGTSIGSVSLARELGRPAIGDELRDAGLFSTYEATADPDTSVVSLAVAGPEPGDVLTTAETLISMAPEVLEAAVGSESASGIRVAALANPVDEDLIFKDDSYGIEIPLIVLPAGVVDNPFSPNNATIGTLTELSRRADVAQALLTEVPSATYLVDGPGRSVAPIMSITVETPEVSQVPRAYAIINEQLGRLLADLQTNAGVPSPEQTVLVPLVPPAEVTRTSSSIVRPAAALALLGIGAACAAAVFADLLIQRRAQRSTALEP